MKKTAVEWLKDQIECFGNKHELQMSWATLDELLEQAKQMEHKQITDAYSTYAFDEHGRRIHASQYYKETYGGQDE